MTLIVRVASAIGCVALAGCGPGGPPLHSVTGRVLLTGGKPVEGAVVEFASPDGSGARGRTGPGGQFELATGGLPGAVAGTHRVAVLQMVVADGAASHVGPHHAPLVVHPRYAGFATSGLTREVRAGPNDFTIEVEPAAQKRGW